MSALKKLLGNILLRALLWGIGVTIIWIAFTAISAAVTSAVWHFKAFEAALFFIIIFVGITAIHLIDAYRNDMFYEASISEDEEAPAKKKRRKSPPAHAKKDE